MATPKIFESEYRFCQVLWANEPIKSTELAKRCNEKLGRSKTTTYTVIKRLCDRGAIQNENTIVTSLVSQDEVQAAEIDELVEKKFDGSLPAFVAAFTRHQKLSGRRSTRCRPWIDRYRKEQAMLSCSVSRRWIAACPLALVR